MGQVSASRKSPALGCHLSSLPWAVILTQTAGHSRHRGGRRSFAAGWQDSCVFVVALGGRVGKAEKQGLRLQSTSPPASPPSEEIFRGLVVLRGGDRKRL